MLTTKTQLEKDLTQKDASILYAASQTQHLASVLTEENKKFWSLPTDRLLAVLNADVQKTGVLFATNTALGQAINASLDAVNAALLAAGSSLPLFTKRAPVEPGRADIQFVDTQFVVVEGPPPPPAIPDEV